MHLKYKCTKFSTLLTILGLLLNFVFVVIKVLKGILLEVTLFKTV